MEKWLRIFAKQFFFWIKNGQFSFFDILQLPHTVISNSENWPTLMCNVKSQKVIKEAKGSKKTTGLCSSRCYYSIQYSIVCERILSCFPCTVFNTSCNGPRLEIQIFCWVSVVLTFCSNRASFTAKTPKEDRQIYQLNWLLNTDLSDCCWFPVFTAHTTSNYKPPNNENSTLITTF